MSNIPYSLKRLAAAMRKKDYENVVEELHRINYVFGMEHSLNNKVLCFYPAGISCQINGVTQYTARMTDKPKGERFKNLVK